MAYFSERSGYDRFQMFPPVIKVLLIVNIAAFVLGFVLPQYVISIPTDEGLQPTQIGADTLFGGLWPISSPFWIVTQYFTYMFLHGGIGHIFFNMLALWMFGMELEQLWGSKRFLIYYLICGLGAGVMQSIVTSLEGSHFPTVGASGAIMGVMVAFGMLFPDRIIYLQFFFPLKAKYAVLVFAAIDLYMGVASQPGDNVAHFAHLGGALVGFIMIMAGGKMTLGGLFDRRRKAPPVAPPKQQERARVIDVRFRESEPAAPAAQPASSRHAPVQMNFGSDQERIDAILDKISRSGYQTLTDEEKAILTEASKRMR
jgi:membrane associated rhomboid family serine protease